MLPNVSVGANIKRLREAAGWRQDDLAKAASVKQSDVSKWERGSIPTIRPLIRMAVALNVSVENLIAGVDATYDHARADATHPNKSEEKSYDVTPPDTTPELESPAVAARGDRVDVETKGSRRPAVRSPLNIAKDLHAQARAMQERSAANAKGADAIVALADELAYVQSLSTRRARKSRGAPRPRAVHKRTAG